MRLSTNLQKMSLISVREPVGLQMVLAASLYSSLCCPAVGRLLPPVLLSLFLMCSMFSDSCPVLSLVFALLLLLFYLIASFCFNRLKLAFLFH